MQGDGTSIESMLNSKWSSASALGVRRTHPFRDSPIQQISGAVEAPLQPRGWSAYLGSRLVPFR
jgi:hypothetical protein